MSEKRTVILNLGREQQRIEPTVPNRADSLLGVEATQGGHEMTTALKSLYNFLPFEASRLSTGSH